MEIFYMEGYFIKNNQKLSILILIPMLILSFILTFKSKPIDNNAKSTIYNYIECINKKDLASIFIKCILFILSICNFKSEILSFVTNFEIEAKSFLLMHSI